MGIFAHSHNFEFFLGVLVVIIQTMHQEGIFKGNAGQNAPPSVNSHHTTPLNVVAAW